MSAAVGADVESLCSKCGDVWHVVVAKVGDRIVKVQCKECHKQHRHRPPGGGARPTAAQASRGPARTSAPRAARTTVKAPPVEEGPRVTADPTRPPRPYRAADTYDAGDRITHPTFGSGIVEGSPGGGKIEVYFPSGRKVLAQAKAASTLERPPVRTAAEDAAAERNRKV